MFTNTEGDKISNTFCILPWIHLSTRPNSKTRVCCSANASAVSKYQGDKNPEIGVIKDENNKPANLNNSDLLTMWNSEYMKNIRLKMLNGEEPESCTKCFNEERAGHGSKRQWETKYWSHRLNINEIVNETNNDGSVPPKLRYLDLRMGTKCNLKCVMCSPHDSSEWVKDWKKLYPQLENENLRDTMQWGDKQIENGASYNWHKNNPKFWKQLYDNIPYMQQLYFAGGEPLLIDEHYSLLEKIIEMGYAHKMEVRYNANGTIIPKRLLELWKYFKKVRFHFSMDDIMERNEYIRYPSNWSTIYNNLWYLEHNCPDNVEITIACAVQALNIYYIPDFIEWKLKQGFTKINPFPFGAGLINMHFVYHPGHLNVKMLPQWFKDETKEKYENFYKWLENNWDMAVNYRDDVDYERWRYDGYGIKRLQGIINFMMSGDWSNRIPEFQEYIQKMDELRETSFESTFPEMKKIMHE